MYIIIIIIGPVAAGGHKRNTRHGAVTGNALSAAGCTCCQRAGGAEACRLGE